jgi:hypothetical protein
MESLLSWNFSGRNEEKREGPQDGRCSQRDSNWDHPGKCVLSYRLQIDTQNVYGLKTASLFETDNVSLHLINTVCAT